MYVPNPSCKDFRKYEWIGKLIGAALRSKEFLVSTSGPPWPARGLGECCCVTPQVMEGHMEDACLCSLWQILALPALVWKQLAGEEVVWSKDFAAVDAELVSGAGVQQGSAVHSCVCSGSTVMAFALWGCR